MKTLERFWQWHRDEQPTVERARKMLDANVSSGGRAAVDIAASHIDCHANGGGLGHRFYTAEALAHYPEALRELSLVLCRGLARMVEQVPKREPVTFRREYLGEWHSPDTADAMAYALRASTALARQNRLLGYGKCSMHTEFYGGCLTCQQARYRDQREQKRDRMAAMYETMPMPAVLPEQTRYPCTCVHARGDSCTVCSGVPQRELRNRIMLSRDGVQSRADADKFRGMDRHDWHILGTFDEWYCWGGMRGLDLLQYLVVEVLAPGGAEVTADSDRLTRRRWWPR